MAGYGFLAPALLLVGLVSIYPIVLVFDYALRRTSYFDVGAYVGLDNFTRVLSDPGTVRVLGVSAQYVFGSLTCAVLLALPLALALNREDRVTSVLRPLVLMPWVVSQLVTALLWLWILNPSFGPLNHLFRSVTGQSIDMLGTPRLALITVIIANVWMTYPIITVLVLAALKTVPAELYEAVEVDGGSWFHKQRHVTMPYIKSTLAIACILNSVLYLNMVTLIYTMTGGGPLGGTETLSIRIYLAAFEFNQLAFSSVYAIIAVVVNVVFSLAYLRVLRNDD